MSDDVLRWIDGAGLTIAPGAPLELEPWQRAVLEHAAAELQDVTTELECSGRRSPGRRRISARSLAVQLALGTGSAMIATADEASARELLERVRLDLGELGEAYGIDVGPLLRATTPPGEERRAM